MKGLTLLETLVAIGIFSFIILGIFSVLGVGGANYSANLTSLNLQQQVRQGMNWLTKEARQAYWDSIEIPAVVDAYGNHSITFNTMDSTGVEYFVEPTTVAGKTLWQLKRRDPAHTEVKANDIKLLTFSKDSSEHILSIRMQASKTFRSFGKDQTLVFSLNEQIQVRNS